VDAERRKFLQQLGTLCSAGVARTLGFGASAGTFAAAATGTAAAASGATSIVAGTALYGAGVRQQVLEVIVRQALAGAPWKEICKGPMLVNGITEDEVNAEIAKRRLQGHTGKLNCNCEKCVETRAERSRQIQASLDAIPHSPVSPCACKECRVAVDKTIREIKSQLG
jgi:hypothetical protein